MSEPTVQPFPPVALNTGTERLATLFCYAADAGQRGYQPVAPS